ncbi:hypothetical protein B566_EDAN017422 [Ephemera danica]|nr:hypothetical protein B566_EDAN017422 [Ephemera danica]
MNPDDYEKLPTNNILTNMGAGAIAGILEHCVMYPLDSVKTRMQSVTGPTHPPYRGIGGALFDMVLNEGISRPVRGMSAVIVGAGPAHALYFSCYEMSREKLTSLAPHSTHLMTGVAGSFAALLHDAVMNPAEVVKQRLQMCQSPYRNCMDCIKHVYKTEGIGAFYRSYATQLTMNIPFQSIHFMMYELMQNWTNKERHYSPAAHMVSGAVAGAVAAAATTPLDVCKTLLNTQEAEVTGLAQAARTVYYLRGVCGFFGGLKARVLFQMPSTAICWSTYEFFKYLLRKRDNDMSEVTTIETEVSKLRDEFPSLISSTSSQTAQGAALTPNPSPSLYGVFALKTVQNHDSGLRNTSIMEVSPISRS